MNIADSVAKLKQISSIDLNLDGSYDLIYSTLKNIFLPYNIITLKKYSYLFRARPARTDIEIYSKSYMSYNPDSKSIREFGRANKPSQSMFYASNKTETAVFETSSLIRDNKKETKVENLILGRWFVKRDIKLLGIISNEEAILKNPNIYGLNKSISNELSSQPEIKWIDKFISDVFAKNVKGNLNQYKLSSAFYNYMQYRLGEQVEGVLFPSVEYEYNDTNVALKPDTVEDGLILDMVGDYRIDFNYNPVEINQISFGDIQTFKSNYI